MANCKECGAHVSDSFARVFGDNDGNLYGCIYCGASSSSKRHKEELDHTRTTQS